MDDYSKLMSLGFHETLELTDGTTILCVRSGWIYTMYDEKNKIKSSSVYVPFNK